MSELEAEIQRIDAEIEVLQRVRSRLQAKVVREPSAFAARPKWHLPAEEPAPKVQPRRERGNSEPSKVVMSVLKVMQRLGPASYSEISRASGKTGATLQKSFKVYGRQLEDKRWTLNEAGQQALARNSQTNHSQSPSSDQQQDSRE